MTAAPHRALSLAEALAATLLVAAHSVFGVGPRAVPLLFLAALVSIRLREKSWRAIGFMQPSSWAKTVIFAVLTAAAVVASAMFISGPAAKALGLASTHAGPMVLGPIKDDALAALQGLVAVWIGAAVLEEVVYRRYVLVRVQEALGGTTAAAIAALLFSALLFGLGHYYQGPAGVFARSLDGLIIGAAYLLSRKNLWLVVIAHGLIDTVGIVTIYLGYAH